MEHSSLTSGFLPNGHCYLWRPDILWLHVISDSLMVAAYFAVLITMLIALRSVQNLPYRWAFVMFAAFIILSGMTHVASIVAIWEPIYYIEGYLKALTGAISVTAAVLLIPTLPRALGAVLNEFSRNSGNAKL